MPLIGASTCVRRAAVSGSATNVRSSAASRCAPDRVAVDAVLDLDDRAVEDVEQEVVARAGFLRDRLAGRQVLAAGDVAEEVALALGAGREQRRRLGRDAPEHLGQRLADGLRARAPNLAVARLRWQVSSRSASCSRYCSERKSRSSWPRKASSAPFSAPVLPSAWRNR